MTRDFSGSRYLERLTLRCLNSSWLIDASVVEAILSLPNPRNFAALIARVYSFEYQTDVNFDFPPAIVTCENSDTAITRSEANPHQNMATTWLKMDEVNKL